MTHERLQQQIEFLIEIDKIKSVLRRTRLIDRSRYENSGEHSWHLATYALILSEYANDSEMNILKVLKLLLIHDIVEIDAGDTFAYDTQGLESKGEREEAAAKRIFGLLPSDQQEEFYTLWREFEDRKTPEAQFKASLDRLQPLLHNYSTQGDSWQKYGVTQNMVLERNEHIGKGSEQLWDFVQSIIAEAVEKGYLPRG